MKKVNSMTLAIIFVALTAMAFTVSNSDGKSEKEVGDKFIAKDPKTDNLLTSENTVLLVIDWQDEMLGVVKNIDTDVLTNNIQAMIKTANVFDIPVIESTIGVDLGANKPTVPAIKQFIESDVKNIDRVSLNAWQNQDVIDAVKKTGRKKVIITGLWTSGCPTYTALDAMQDGYEVYLLIAQAS
jgi:nicotinamidase-related amidase